MQQALKKYMQDNKLSSDRMAEKLGVHVASIYSWKSGRSTPRSKKNRKKLMKLGIIPETGEVRREEAIQKIYKKQDDKNKPTRAYRRHLIVPEILAQQIGSVLDGYVQQLSKQRTWAEFQEERGEVIRQIVYLCKQGV